MRGSHRYARLFSAPLKNESMAPSKARASRSNRREASRDSRSSFDVSRRRTNPGRMSADDIESVGDEQRRDGSLGMSSKREVVGDFEGEIGGA